MNVKLKLKRQVSDYLLYTCQGPLRIEGLKLQKFSWTFQNTMQLLNCICENMGE